MDGHMQRMEMKVSGGYRDAYRIIVDRGLAQNMACRSMRRSWTELI